MVERLGSVEQGGGGGDRIRDINFEGMLNLAEGDAGHRGFRGFLRVRGKLKASVWYSGSGVPVISSVSRHTLLKNSAFIISCWISFLALCSSRVFIAWGL